MRVTALEGEGVALHLDTHRYYTLNGTGLRVLEALADSRSAPELGALLAAAYDVSAHDAEAATRAFLEQCETRGVVVRIEP
jgi:hypothetical protein